MMSPSLKLAPRTIPTSLDKAPSAIVEQKQRKLPALASVFPRSFARGAPSMRNGRPPKDTLFPLARVLAVFDQHKPAPVHLRTVMTIVGAVEEDDRQRVRSRISYLHSLGFLIRTRPAVYVRSDLDAPVPNGSQVIAQSPALFASKSDDHPDWILVDRWNAGDRDAGQKLLRKHSGLIHRIAYHYRSMGLEDALQEARIGFMRGISKATRGRGATPSTYAMQWARAGAGRAAEAQDTVRVPHRNERRSASASLGGSVMGVMGTPALLYRRSLDSPVRRDDPNGATLGEMLADEAPRPDDEGLRDAVVRALDVADMLVHLSKLPPREADVLRCRFGIGREREEHGEQTLEVIGKRMGVSRERVRQIEKKGLHRLRDAVFAASLSSSLPLSSPLSNEKMDDVENKKENLDFSVLKIEI